MTNIFRLIGQRYQEKAQRTTVYDCKLVLLRFTPIFFLLISFNLGALETITFKELPFENNEKKDITQGEIKISSKVDSFKNTNYVVGSNFPRYFQTMNFKIAGIHPQDCMTALKKMSKYEKYQDYIKAIEQSRYYETSKTVDFLLDYFLLPFKMRLTFILPRITKPGTYLFLFRHGIFKNLRGEIHVSDIDNKCLFFTKANWQGEDTRIPDWIVSLFSRQLALMTMKRLFEI